MTPGENNGPDPVRVPPASDNGVPETNKAMMVAAGVLLAIPVVALMWVPSYAKDKPELWGFPFFFWYQFLWVFLCSAATWTAYKLTVAARRNNGSGK
ncbi:MAG: DUF3311 domain-containing protein [Marmoricola sp.]